MQENLRLSGHLPLQRLLGDFLGSLVNEPVYSSPEHDSSVHEIICRLLGFAVKEGDQTSIQGVGSDRPLRKNILRYVEANLHDPDLSASKVAQALGCSRRSIYRMFDASEGQDESLGRYIWRKRVERCALAIRSGRDYGTLTNLAYSFGFSSSEHFCRAFKRQVGVSPSIYAGRYAVNV